jgi:tetratricopeptide (TPR) repeat protein
MNPRDLPIELVFRVLPATPELRALRDAILAESVGDRSRRWEASTAYGTVDQRVVPRENLEQILATAEETAVAQVRAVHASLAGVLTGLASGDTSDVLARFVELGEAAREKGEWRNCVEWFRVTLSLASEIGARDKVILAARRMGLAHLHLGNIREARESYERSMREAEAIDQRNGRTVAHIGLGHLLGMQGQWQDAEKQYKKALELCPAEDELLCGQIELNLATATRECGDFDASAHWLDQSKLRWASLTRSDRSVWFNSRGMLLLYTDDLVGARAALENALAHAGSYLDTAMILDNLSDLAIRQGDLVKAEAYARRGEEFAIVGNASRALAEIYIRLAMITRLRGEENGIGFLEKAIEISRAESYYLAHASALQEYALLRERMQDFEAARNLRLEAATILDSLAG